MEAGAAAGFARNPDYNGAQQEGFGRSQYTIRDGRRSSSARAYLRPARHRRNLLVETGAHVTRVLLEGTRAVGVELIKGSGDRVGVRASREVIVCAGTFNSPQLLMLSGIGPATHLREFGIAPVVDLPVGRNLQDHLGAYLSYARRQPRLPSQMRFDHMVVSIIAPICSVVPAVVPGSACLHQDRPGSRPTSSSCSRHRRPHLVPAHGICGPASFAEPCCIPTAAADTAALGDPRDPPRIC